MVTIQIPSPGDLVGLRLHFRWAPSHLWSEDHTLKTQMWAELEKRFVKSQAYNFRFCESYSLCTLLNSAI